MLPPPSPLVITLQPEAAGPATTGGAAVQRQHTARCAFEVTVLLVPAALQICIILFQQLHYYDIPSLVHRCTPVLLKCHDCAAAAALVFCLQACSPKRSHVQQPLCRAGVSCRCPCLRDLAAWPMLGAACGRASGPTSWAAARARWLAMPGEWRRRRGGLVVTAGRTAGSGQCASQLHDCSFPVIVFPLLQTP